MQANGGQGDGRRGRRASSAPACTGGVRAAVPMLVLTSGWSARSNHRFTITVLSTLSNMCPQSPHVTVPVGLPAAGTLLHLFDIPLMSQAHVLSLQ